jgi:hypothetical protein
VMCVDLLSSILTLATFLLDAIARGSKMNSIWSLESAARSVFGVAFFRGSDSLIRCSETSIFPFGLQRY